MWFALFDTRLRAPCAYAVALLVLYAGLIAPAGCAKEDPPAAGSSPSPVAKRAGIFRDVTAEAGLDFVSYIGATGKYYMPEIMGPGCALFDYDNDGDLDAYALQGALPGSDREPEESLWPFKGRWPPRNRLFRNELMGGVSGKNRLVFVDVTEQAGVGDTGYGMGVAVGDYDNDGFADLYVTNWGPNVLYHNNGDGTFTDVTAAAGVGDPGWSASTAFLDYDNDGFLDLFVVNYVDFTITGHIECYSNTGAREYCSPNAYKASPDRIYHNNGDGTFTDATLSTGIYRAYGNGLGVACADFNGDGLIDIYVANDANANQLWINRGDGTFEDESLLAGAAYNENGLPEAGMGVTAGDPDLDGDEDIFVTHLIDETNTYYRNNGEGMFDDRTERAGFGSCSRMQTGFGTGWIDYDNDARLDLFIVNGAVKAVPILSGDPFPYHIPNQVLRNLGQDRFADVSDQAGPGVRVSEVSRGAAFGDVDNDGDGDVLVSNNNGPLRLLLNEVGNRNPWIRLRLEGRSCNRSAIGTLVVIKRPGAPALHRRVQADGSYCSASDLRLTVGLGSDPVIEAIDVHWPGGRVERWTGPAVGTETVLRQGEGQPVAQ